MKILSENKKRILSLVLSMLISITTLPTQSLAVESIQEAEPAEQTAISEYESTGEFHKITESYKVDGGKIEEASGNTMSTYISGKAKFAIYKIPVPRLNIGKEYDKFVIRFGRGGTSAFKVLGLNGDDWDFSSVPKTIELTDERIAPLISASTVDSYSALDTELETVTNDYYNLSYADITAYANASRSSGKLYMYIAVGAWNSTTNCALSSLTDSDYLRANVNPMFAYSEKNSHSVESYKSIGGFNAISESFILSNGTLSDDKGNFASSIMISSGKIRGNMAIYKFPLPTYHESERLDRFIIRFGKGSKSALKVLKIDCDLWDMNSLPLEVGNSNPQIAPFFNLSTVDSYSALDAEVIYDSAGGYFHTYADVTNYAKEAYFGGKSHFYVAVGTWNTTTNIALTSMTDTTYRGLQLYPGYFYTMEPQYDEPLPRYPEISPERFEKLFESTVEKGHPWLYGTREDFDRVKEYAFGKDAAMTEMYQKIKDAATVYVDKAVSKVAEDVVLSRATDAMNIIRNCAFIYMVEGEEAKDYADRAVNETMYFVEQQETWGRGQSLDINHLSMGIAVCYDWLYDYLTPQQRTAIAEAMFAKHLDEVYDFFNNPTDPKYKWSFHQMYNNSNNHAVLDNCSVFVEALAFADYAPEKCASIMSLALKHLNRHNGPFDRFFPDSGWYEGSSYWSYVGPFMAWMFSSMDAAFGSCFGYEENPYITGAAYFPIYTQSNRERFIYSDAGTGVTNHSAFYWFGKMAGDKALQKYVVDNRFATDPTSCIWYDPAELDSTEISLQKDKLIRNIDIATMRSSWDNPHQIFTGMVVQKPRETHAFMAMGTLALDALGETWITNPGKEDYDIGDYWNTAQDGTRWTYYSTRAEANGCLVINPSEDGGQIANSPAVINKFESGDSKAFVMSDLSTAYADAEEYKRGVMLYDNRSKVLLQDEVTLEKTSDVYSFINVFKADIDIAEDGSYAILSKGNKHILVKVYSDKPYELTTYEACATALGTSPNPDVTQKDFTKNFERLTVRYDDVSGSINLKVVFVPFLSDNVPEVAEPKALIDEWTTDENALKKPELSYIKVNGKKIEGFRGDVNYYKLPLEYFEAKIETEAPGCSVEIKNNFKNNTFDIYVTDNKTGAENHYCIDTVFEGKVIADTSVGGSMSSDSYYLSRNYGSQETVAMRIMAKYSLMSYYKLQLPYIPLGKKIKNVSLVLNQYRNANSSTKDAYEFHLVDPSTWQEDKITYYNAPVRHSYLDDGAWYPYKKSDNPGTTNKATYTTETTPDLQMPSLNIKTVPTRQGKDDRFYAEHSYDLTTLVEKSNFADLRRNDNIFSFGMGHYVPGQWSSGSNTTIASKEHSNELLHPKLLVETDNVEGVLGVVAEKGKILANPTGEEQYYTSENQTPSQGGKMCAISYAVNFENSDKEVDIFVAQYDSSGKLLKASRSVKTAKAAESTTLVSDTVDVADGARVFKAFVWADNIKPLN